MKEMCPNSGYKLIIWIGKYKTQKLKPKKGPWDKLSYGREFNPSKPLNTKPHERDIWDLFSHYKVIWTFQINK